MRVEVDNDNTPEQKNQTALNQPTPLEIARIIAECTVPPLPTNVSEDLESFRTRKNNQSNKKYIPEKQNKNIPSYQNNRPVKNHSHKSVTHASPPMPIHPPPVRPSPSIEDSTTNHHRMQQRAQQRWLNGTRLT